ncbi:zinc ribbon domain-containing protein [Sutcliffiella horikoshii]|uniref:zinc ribbon domain-containing protein n=1 Tax=Sutcliffiella horikoshii TaxID=79883 RepID=UPI001F2A6ADC|nr:zinc ribbon domain-containing protein [Sutcliffiella horikoshii]MCG1021382.1 zinc ribbon domain-containing protein [Sutcliffiella horikoshii]
MKYCPKCGTERHNDFNFCGECSFDFKSITLTSHLVSERDTQEIMEHVRFRYDSAVEQVTIIDEKNYLVTDDKGQTFQVRVGGLISPTSSKILNSNFSLDHSTGVKKNNGYLTTGFILGLASVFLAFIGIIPIAGIIINIIGLVKFNSFKEKNYWMGIAGLILSFIYFFIYLKLYGHIG